MKKFKFTLEAVVVVRELALNRAESAYAQALQACRGQEAEHAAVRTNIAALQQQVERVRATDFCAADQQHFILAQTHAFEALAAQEQKLAQLQANVQTKLNAFIQAKKAYDALIRIKERKYQDYLKAHAKQEERELEDIFCNRYSSAVD